MKRFFVLAGLLLLSQWAFSQADSTAALEEIMNFRRQLDSEFQDPKESPLGEKGIPAFEGHRFFPADLHYRVIAKVERLSGEKVFKMQTTTERKPEYIKVLKLHFTLRDTACVLYAYRNLALAAKEEYKDHLFLPFTDLSNGFESYGGGRYIDLRIPEGDSMILDFNLSYNPYCAYSGKYSCPVPPAENRLPVKVEAGILAPAEH
ncbi:MAG: DUF1684 domain-containing protein [Bacteroidia bacterium]|nr:DUF1684 domain-containing protein [Bacteroidia bacterium]